MISCPTFVLTRRRKIAILILVVVSLFLTAVLSSYLAEEPAAKASSKHNRRNVLVRRGGDASESESFGKRGSKTLRRSKGHKGSNSEKDHKRQPPPLEEDHIEVEEEDPEEFFHKGRKRPRKGLEVKHREVKEDSEEEIVPANTLKKDKRQSKKLKQGQKKVKSPVPITSVKMAANNDERFNAERVLHLFSSCRKSDGEIVTDCYVDGYEELCKLFKAFGSVFTFVTSDVVEKIGILREYRKSPEADKYETFQSLLSYEVEKDITASKKKASGSRTLLRLHRALEFVEELLVKIKDTDNKEKFSTVASQAYDDTLAKHHPWLIKKAVHVAMYVLPTRVELLKKMNLEDSENGMHDLAKLIDELDIIFKITQDLYAKDDLLNLP